MPTAYNLEELMTIDYWIEQAGGTLEAHITVPLLLPYLNPELIRARDWLRKVKRFLNDSKVQL